MANDDVKIYRSTPAAPAEIISEGERSAAVFLRHKENGNLAKCRELGILLGKTFVDDAKRLENDPYRKQKLVLLAFVVTDELAGIIFDQVLQKSAQSVFQKTVEQSDSQLFACISDSAAVTLYILDDRNSDDGLGDTFASLCGKEGDRELIETGNAIAHEYRRLCADIISSYSFTQVE